MNNEQNYNYNNESEVKATESTPTTSKAPAAFAILALVASLIAPCLAVWSYLYFLAPQYGIGYSLAALALCIAAIVLSVLYMKNKGKLAAMAIVARVFGILCAIGCIPFIVYGIWGMYVLCMRT